MSYPDAQAAQNRLAQGQIAALSPPSVPDLAKLLAPYNLGDGERDSILLSEHADLQDVTLVIDDHLAYLVSDRLGQRIRTGHYYLGAKPSARGTRLVCS